MDPQALNEVSFTVPIAAGIRPQARLLVHYTSPEGEVVADSINLNINRAFENKVSIHKSRSTGNHLYSDEEPPIFRRVSNHIMRFNINADSPEGSPWTLVMTQMATIEINNLSVICILSVIMSVMRYFNSPSARVLIEKTIYRVRE